MFAQAPRSLTPRTCHIGAYVIQRFADNAISARPSINTTVLRTPKIHHQAVLVGTEQTWCEKIL